MATLATRRNRGKLSEQRAEAYARATTGRTCDNDMLVILAFESRGISDVRPRENVFTYRAWQHVGRQVLKGEKGVQVTTWIPCSRKERTADGSEKTVEFCRPKTATVFHVSQTKAIEWDGRDA